MALIGRTLRSQVACTGWTGLGSVLLLSLLAATHGSEVAGQTVDVANPAHFQCVGKNRYSGVPVVPSESNGDALGVAYSAILFDSSSGKPLIVYGSRFRNMSPLMQSLPTVDATTRNAIVYVDLTSNVAAKSGMFASGEFSVGSARALSVPQQAVVLRDGMSYVYQLLAENKVSQLKVQTGRRFNDRVEISSGLKGSETLVVGGAAFLAQGDTVRVVAEAK